MNILLDATARPVIAHRGNRAFAPENTIESFVQAVALGADAIEFDVGLSADGIPVVHHDPTVRRTTGGTGEIARMTFAELRLLDAGGRFTPDNGRTFPYRDKGHRIPSLDEVVEAFPSTALLIEIKDPLAATGVKASLESHGATARTVVDSFSSEALRVFAGSDIAIGAGKSGATRLMWEVVLGRVITPFTFQALCVPLRYYGVPVPVHRFSQVARTQNCRVHVWTINDERVARDLWTAGVNGIITDDPAAMLSVREASEGA